MTGIRRRATGETHGAVDGRAGGSAARLLPQADVVVIAAPQTRDTRGLIGAPSWR